MLGSGKSLISGPLECAHTRTHTQCAVHRAGLSPGASRAPVSKPGEEGTLSLPGLPQQNSTEQGISPTGINLIFWKLEVREQAASRVGLWRACGRLSLTLPSRGLHCAHILPVSLPLPTRSRVLLDQGPTLRTSFNLSPPKRRCLQTQSHWG